MLYLSICVFCICMFVFACLTHGNIIFDILEQSSFQKYATCWVFLALPHMLYLCICVFCICICLCLCLEDDDDKNENDDDKDIRDKNDNDDKHLYSEGTSPQVASNWLKVTSGDC